MTQWETFHSWSPTATPLAAMLQPHIGTLFSFGHEITPPAASPSPVVSILRKQRLSALLVSPPICLRAPRILISRFFPTRDCAEPRRRGCSRSNLLKAAKGARQFTSDFGENRGNRQEARGAVGGGGRGGVTTDDAEMFLCSEADLLTVWFSVHYS